MSPTNSSILSRRISRRPGSGNGRLMSFQVEAIFDLIEVTALKAPCLVSRSFLPAETYPPWAANGSAASARCSGVKVLRVPNQANDTLTAAMLARRFVAGELALV